MRGWRKRHGLGAQDLRNVTELLVMLAADVRLLLPCPPDAPCVECSTRRERIADCEETAGKLARAWRGTEELP
jgi:hypothetical protein